MELFVILLMILQSISVSLGVGSSTLAISNFFVAIADGKIDGTERNMMGVVYIVLRVAMVLILLTTGTLTYLNYGAYGGIQYSSFNITFWTLIAVLFINAILMTKHIMPSTVGPALQASTWYTMGVTMTLHSLGLANYALLHYYLSYAVVILFALSLVNGIMAVLKHMRPTS